MSEFIQIEIDLHTLANKLVSDGDADRLFELLNYAALEVQQHYARQRPMGDRYATFSGRSRTSLNENTKLMLRMMMVEKQS
jgi:hypothetical protein